MREKEGERGAAARLRRIPRAKDRSRVFLLRARKAVTGNGRRGEQTGGKTEREAKGPWWTVEPFRWPRRREAPRRF